MKFFANLKNLLKKKEHKLGLTLGSGGAKGMALIGALKVFEEYGIKFDMVSGTSIGSIVGGMYAGAHSTTEMFDFLKQFDVTNPATLIMMKLKGMTVESLLDKVVGGANIEDLKMPYFAVACDIDTGEEIVMDSGNLAKAMACSSAIPPVFKPVTRGNRKLIDGAYVNSIPADVLKAHGASLVITVSLTEGDKNTKIKENLDKLYKGNGVKLADRMIKGRQATDFIIEPDLSEFSAMSIGSLSQMYQRGYDATKQAMPQILELLKKHKFIKK